MEIAIIALAVITAAGSIYAVGRAHGASRERALIEKRRADTAALIKRRLAAVDAAAETALARAVHLHAEEAQARLQQGSGEAPFDHDAAARLLADAGVRVVRK